MSVEPSTKQISKALLSYAEKAFEWDSFSEYVNNYANQRGQVYDVPGLGPVKIVDYYNYDSNKNYDGWYEDIWIVFEIQGKLYKASGKHSSYEMSVWEDEVKLVVPKQKTITVFEEEDKND
jgi:hypothetical protein